MDAIPSDRIGDQTDRTIDGHHVWNEWPVRVVVAAASSAFAFGDSWSIIAATGIYEGSVNLSNHRVSATADVIIIAIDVDVATMALQSYRVRQCLPSQQ